jgi:hypothetical protein
LSTANIGGFLFGKKGVDSDTEVKSEKEPFGYFKPIPVFTALHTATNLRNCPERTVLTGKGDG